MDDKKWKAAFFIFLIITIIATMLSLNLHGKILESRATIMQVTQTPSPTLQWTLLDKILENDPELELIQLNVGDTEIVYAEERVTTDVKGKIIRKTSKAKDYEREIALKLLNTQTGETETIKITKKGGDLISPEGYQIEVVSRPSGIKWNAWNTIYKIIEPENRIVIKNVYPAIKSLKTVKKKRVPNIIENVIYVPFSDNIKTSEIITRGKVHLVEVVNSARNLLNQRGVYSKAFPDKLITEILSAVYYERRPVIEQADYGEFVLDPSGTVDRFLTILGTNTKSAWSETCNRSGACGLYQFTDNGKSGTYRTVAKRYPEAMLIKDFETAAKDQVNSAMAAMLLDDLNLVELVRRYGNKILNDPKLEEYLAASYNGAPKWVHKSMNATLSKNIPEWGKYLRRETKEFMVKLRFLRDNNLP